MRIGVIGAGLVGRRAAAFLADREIGDITLFSRERPVSGLGPTIQTAVGLETQALDALDVAILATESMHQVELAEQLVRSGVAVVATADTPSAVRTLWTLDELVRRHDTTMVVGAGCAPGLSTLLVHHLASAFDRIDAITTARFGTGGPTCAREHHRSMAAPAWEIRDGTGHWVRGGSGRSLVWFPEPAGAQDCYRAGLSEPFLLQQEFPEVDRIQSLQAATRRDRATARLPMLRPPHPEGRVGAVWAEVRGLIDGQIEHRVMAASGPQATAAAATASVLATEIALANVNSASCALGVHGVSLSKNVPHTLRSFPDDVSLWAHASDVVARPPSNSPVQAARKWQPTREISTILPTSRSQLR